MDVNGVVWVGWNVFDVEITEVIDTVFDDQVCIRLQLAKRVLEFLNIGNCFGHQSDPLVVFVVILKWFCSVVFGSN